jgi:hypothetical protein
MREGLKNVGSTFARMTKAFLDHQLQKNIIAYVDDIVVMSKNEEGHIAYLKETFTNLRAVELKLNPENCLQSKSRQNARVHYRARRHQSKSRKDEGHSLNGRAINQERSSEAHRKESSAK